jgi:FPC/CPF motif-containing protein YcgG
LDSIESARQAIPMKSGSARSEGESEFDAPALEAEFASFVGDPTFPCLGAKAALNAGSYILRAYDELGSEHSTAPLARALTEFVQSEMYRRAEFATFVAIFRGPCELTEHEFERLLWLQLQQLHKIDATRHTWDPSVASDPSDPRFSFSIAGHALYVVGMHGNSSRYARRFPWATLIFNPHQQFERLKDEGSWARWKATIRSRDVALQGYTNPMLSDFGDKTEARQYSGREVEPDWKPPFAVAKETAHSAEAGRCPFAH